MSIHKPTVAYPYSICSAPAALFSYFRVLFCSGRPTFHEDVQFWDQLDDTVSYEVVHMCDPWHPMDQLTRV